MKNRYLWTVLLVVGLILRVVSAAFLYHTDTKNIYRDARYFEFGVRNAYINAKKDNNPLPYPPAIYLLINTHRSLDAWMFSPNFPQWLQDGSARQAELHPKLFQDLFAMKFPMFLADLFIALILVLSVVPSKRLLVAALWLLNPVTIYTIYGFGNFDIFPTLFIAVSLLCHLKGKKRLAYFFLGVGSGLKLFAVLLLPVLLVIDRKSIIDKVRSVLFFLLGFSPIIGPLFLSKEAITSVFLSNLSGTLFKTQINLADGHILPIFLVVYFIILGLIISKKIIFSYAGAIVVILGLLLGLSHFHPQWMLWVTAGLIFLVTSGEVSMTYTTALILAFFGVSILINDKFVGLGLLKGINEAFDSIKSVRFYADIVGVGTQAQGLFQALFLSSISIMSLELMSILKPNPLKTQVRYIIGLLIMCWVIYIPTSFVIAHIPLIKYGRYIDTERMDQKERLILDEKMVVRQIITPLHDNLSAILIKVKNVGLANSDNLLFSIDDETGQMIRNVVIDGRTIGDDFDMIVYFDPIPDSKDKRLFVTLDQPIVKKETEMIIPYDQNSPFPGLYVNGIQVQGSLAYTTYYNPGNLKDNLIWSMRNIVTKLGNISVGRE